MSASKSGSADERAATSDRAGEQQALFEAPIGLSIAKLADLAAWAEGRAPRPRWFRHSRSAARDSLETGCPNRVSRASEPDLG